MPGWLCSIWRFVLNIFSAILEIVLSVIKAIVDFIVEAVVAVADGIGKLLKNPIVLLLAAGAAIWFLTKDDDGNDGETQAGPA